MCTSDIKTGYDWLEDNVLKPQINVVENYYDYLEDLVTGKSTQNPLQELYEPLEQYYKEIWAPPNLFGLGKDNEDTRRMTRDVEGFFKDNFRQEAPRQTQPAPAGPQQATAASQASTARADSRKPRSYGTNALQVGGRNYGGL